MKTLRFILLSLFLFICSLVEGQVLHLDQMYKLVQSAYFSDSYLVENKFIRIAAKWINDDGYLITQYMAADKKSVIEIGSSNDFVNCIITTKESNYVNFLVAEAFNSDFVKDKNLKNNSENFYPIVLKKGKLQFGVTKDNNDVYKISLNRDYQEEGQGWHFIK